WIAHAAESVPRLTIPAEAGHEDSMPELRSDWLSARSPRSGVAQSALSEMLGEFPDERDFRDGARAPVEPCCRGIRHGSGIGWGALLREGWFLRRLGRARTADAPSRAG